MKRSILILVSLLSFALGNVLPSLAQHPFYIYRNDGGFNAFYHDDIDSIMYSNYDADSIYHADIVSQVIYAYDSVFVIPLAAIDSVSFITPETVYKPGVRVIDDLAEYVITSDSLSFVLAYATPQTLLPKIGDKIVTSISTDGFPEGFVGEVLTIENEAEGIKVSCERVGITDIYEVYFGLSQGGEYGAGSPRRRVKDGGNQGPVIIRPGKFGPDLKEEITGEYCYAENMAVQFTPDLAFTFEPVWTIKPFVIVSPQTGIYLSAVCVADYMCEERLGGTGTLQIKKEFPIPVLSLYGVPVHYPWLFFYEEVGVFLRADLSASFKMKWNQHFRHTFVFEYSSKREQVLKRPSKPIRLINKSKEVEGLLNGTVALGDYVELGFTLVNKRIDRVGVRCELGFEASAQAVLMKRDFEAASRSIALYEQMRDCGFAINKFGNISLLAAVGPWSVEVGPTKKEELWRMSYVPEFSDVVAERQGDKAHCELTARGNILTPVGVGFTLLDKDDNSIVSDFSEYAGKTAGYELDLPNVPRRKSYTVYPTVKAWDYTMLATPTDELPQAELPVRITSFKQTASYYRENGYSYEDKTYSYQYHVTVTVELTDSEGVEDWGYVYEDPNGKIARISLKDFSSPYLDDRYVYYRNEAKSSVRLYEFVKYVGSEDYEYGEPVDYNVQMSYLNCPDDNHPHAIDLGLPSGTKWACCNVGASSPEEYGGYYAWGETEEKSYYGWETYIHLDWSESTCHHIGDDIAGTQYDVAHVKWGGSWRMPTYEQQMELIENCESTQTTQNGINGLLVTGPNGSTIFLSAAGIRVFDYLDGEGSRGIYWSSSHYSADEDCAYCVNFDHRFEAGDWRHGDDFRYVGRSVRPVCP